MKERREGEGGRRDGGTHALIAMIQTCLGSWEEEGGI